MLYKEFKDKELECDDCPLKHGEICSGGFNSNGRGEPIEPPCCFFDDDTDMEQWVKDYYERQRRREAYEDKKIREKSEKDAKNKIAQQRRRESQWHVMSETQEIKRLKNAIRGNKAALHFASSLASAFNFANECFKYEERYEVKDKKPLEIENDKLTERIKELEAIKKQKLKDFNANRKNQENKLCKRVLISKGGS